MRWRWWVFLEWLYGHSRVVRSMQAAAWDDGWGKGREITVRACPSDFNPYRQGR